METVSIPNRALCVYGIGQIDIRPWPLELKASQGKAIVPEGCVLMRVRATGICGSDIHFWKEGSAGPDTFKEPFVLGHENAGEIVDVGAGVVEWKEGDRAAIKPAAPCRICDDCTTGQSNMCPSIRHFGVPGCDGSCCTMKVVPEVQLVRLSDRISWTEAGVIQPLAISLQMSRQAELKAHQNVLILGGGCIGLLLGSISKAYGAAKVVVLDKEPHRAEFARGYCADLTFVSPPRESANEPSEVYSGRVSKHILENVPGLHRGFDVCIEASGVEVCMQMGIKCCRPGGTYVQVGIYGGQHPQIPMIDIASKQLNVRGTWRYTTNCFEQAVSMVDRGLVDVKSLVSHVYDFEDSLEAFETVHSVKDRTGKSAMKVVILHGDGKENEKESMRSSL